MVEDNPGDVRLTQEAFKDAKMHNHLSIVNDGVEAMAFLRNEGKYKDSPRPDVILLDLNMPRMDGREVLKELKKDDKLKTIPVVVLTTSTAEADVLQSYELHANCYVPKPVGFEQFIEVVRNIEGFWLTVVKYPEH